MPTAVLAARRDAGGGLLLVTLDVGAELARAYTLPGQYIELTTAAGAGYFVLAGAPGATPWELLVKNAGDVADALGSLPLGSSVGVAGPMGEGFDLAHAGARPVVMAVVGSALAFARPVMATRIAQGAARATFLFLGLRAPTDLPIPDEVAAWCEAGVSVVLCLSRSELEHHPDVLPRAQRAVGYVQDALARAVEAGAVIPSALVLVAGPDAMLADMRALAATHGAASPAAGGKDGKDGTEATDAMEILTNV
jgi:NAD(P)H-flavin reductase